MLSENQIDLIRQSAEKLAESNVAMTNAFYSHLFSDVPAVRPLFPDDMFGQSQKLWQSIVMVVESADDLGGIQTALRQLGAKHVNYGADEDHYIIVSDVMLETISALMGDDWTADHHIAWQAALDAVCATMLEGAAVHGE